MGSRHTMQDVAVVRQLVKDCANAWNRRDVYAFGQPLAEDADYRTIRGIRLHGREAITQKIFDADCRGARVEIHIDGIRFIHPEVASVEVIGRLHNTSSPFEKVLTTIIVVKTNGEWRIVTINNGVTLPFIAADHQ